LHAQIVASRNGKTKLLYKDIQEWLATISPYLRELKYQDYIAVVKEIIEKGNSSERQYKVFEASQDLKEVIRHNVAEFESGQPRWV
jgi:gamma-glutamyl:cysteine ligase YbdK (ATP-grasp superfamily)